MGSCVADRKGGDTVGLVVIVVDSMEKSTSITHDSIKKRPHLWFQLLLRWLDSSGTCYKKKAYKLKEPSSLAVLHGFSRVPRLQREVGRKRLNECESSTQPNAQDRAQLSLTLDLINALLGSLSSGVLGESPAGTLSHPLILTRSLLSRVTYRGARRTMAHDGGSHSRRPVALRPRVLATQCYVMDCTVGERF